MNVYIKDMKLKTCFDMLFRAESFINYIFLVLTKFVQTVSTLIKSVLEIFAV